MKIYQVGGSVRDMLLGQLPQDIDYVVVGSNIDEMLSQGYLMPNKDFPVFHHPCNTDEYALARREIKIGNKHSDFQLIFDNSISLTQDLARRDFTCNAIAYDVDSKELIDPFGGINDIKQKTLRHITPHFAEDPLRVLRMCRFAAQLDFSIAKETMTIASQMVAKNELSNLSAERIWQEIKRALHYPNFWRFIVAAKECGALDFVLPEIAKLWQTPEKIEYHPEKNSGDHTILVLQKLSTDNPRARFAALLHDIGKTTTPTDILPSHKQHEKRGLEIIDAICQRLKIPSEYHTTASLICRYHMTYHLIPTMRAASIIEMIEDITKKNPTILDDFIAVCSADRVGKALKISKQELSDLQKSTDILHLVYYNLKQIKTANMPNYDKLPKDKRFGEYFRQYKIKQITSILKKQQ